MASKVVDSLFSNVSLAPSDPAFALTAAFHADTSSSKVSLGSGVYRDNDAKPWILPVVKKVCLRVLSPLSLLRLLSSFSQPSDI